MASLWFFCSFANQFIEPLNGVLAVLFLRAIFLCFDDKNSVSGDAFPGDEDQASL